MVRLEPDCPLIANTNISRGAVIKMVICKDSTMNNVSLMVRLVRGNPVTKSAIIRINFR